MFKFFTQKKWFLWSIFGSLFILVSTWYQVQLDVKINNFKLSKPHTGELYYETRKWNSWKYLKNFYSHFLNKQYNQ